MSSNALIQKADFWRASSVLHPLVVGSIVLLCVYAYVRLASARSLSGMTIFSMLVNLSLGSTISRTITQPDLNLTRGLISVAVMLGFEYITDWASAHSRSIAKLFEKEPVLLVFRGEIDHDALRSHRMIEGAIWMTLRTKGYMCIDEVEAVVLEMNGTLSVLKALEDPINGRAHSLERLPEYIKKREEWKQRKEGERQSVDHATPGEAPV